MNQFFPSLISSLNTYVQTAEYEKGGFWAFAFIAIIMVWILAKAFLYFFFNRLSIKRSRVFQIHTVFIWSSALVAALYIAVSIVLWRNGYFVEQPLELSCLIGLFLSSLLLFLSFLSLRNLFSANKGRDLYAQPLSKVEADHRWVASKDQFKRLKWFALLPFLGFLLLLLLLTTSSSLISVVIDNSSSMGEVNENGQIPMETGKAALQKTILGLRERSDIIITTFEPGTNYKSSIQEIVSTTDWSQLKGLNVFFSSEQKQEALNFIRNIQADEDVGSPICETIWKNYLFTKEQRERKDYEDVISIVITDGKEIGVNSDLSGFFCENSNYHEFFGGGTEVFFIDLTGEGSNDFLQKALACSYSIEDGSNPGLYEFSLDRILRFFKRDRGFVYWLGIIYGFFALIIALVEPKK